MDHARQRRLNSDLGRKLRNFFDGALADADMLPGRAALKERIAKDFGDVAALDPAKLEETFIAMARRAQRDDTGSVHQRFEMRGHNVELVDQLVGRIEKLDRIVEHKEPEPVDVKAAAAAAQGTDTRTAQMLASMEDGLRQSDAANR